MKKLVLLLSLLFAFNSCSTDDGDNFRFELLPVESVEMPVNFNVNVINQIKIKYRRPTTCHAFNSFYYEKNLNTRTIAVESIVFEQDGCEALESVLVEKKLNFHVTNNGSYIFKFWQGANEYGEDVFLEYEIPVI